MLEGGTKQKAKQISNYKNMKEFVAAKAEVERLRVAGEHLVKVNLDTAAIQNLLFTKVTANSTYVNFNDGDSSTPVLIGDGTTEESKKNREKLRKIFLSTPNTNPFIDYRTLIGSAFEAPVATEVGSKRSARAVDNQQWKSKRRAVGVQDFAESAASIGAAADVVTDDTERLAKNIRIGADEEDGFKFNGKVEFYHELLSELTQTEQAVASDYLFNPINKAFFITCYQNNVCPPFEILLARPHMTYDMMTCIMMKGGSDTGNTFQGHSDFQLGDDVQSKIHYGNYTYYSKALVTNPKNILLARNVFAGGYVGGDDCDWIERDTYSGNVISGSLYAFLVPAGEHKKENPLRLFTKPSDGYNHSFGREMTGRDYYSRVYGHDSLLSVEDFETIGTRNDTNDIVYQGHQFWWKEHREQNGTAAGGRAYGSYTGVTTNTGHWGKNVYPGCGRVRNGEEVYLKECNWDNEVY